VGARPTIVIRVTIGSWHRVRDITLRGGIGALFLFGPRSGWWFHLCRVCARTSALLPNLGSPSKGRLRTTERAACWRQPRTRARSLGGESDSVKDIRDHVSRASGHHAQRGVRRLRSHHRARHHHPPGRAAGSGRSVRPDRADQQSGTRCHRREPGGPTGRAITGPGYPPGGDDPRLVIGPSGNHPRTGDDASSRRYQDAEHRPCAVSVISQVTPGPSMGDDSRPSARPARPEQITRNR